MAQNLEERSAIRCRHTQRPSGSGGLAASGVALRVARTQEELQITPESVLPRLAALATTPISELRSQWRALFDSDPPNSSRRYLETRLAYRIQELAFGGLSELTLERLRVLAGTIEEERQSARTKRSNDLPIVGTRLVREWQGIEYTVTVRRDGFEFQGRPYKALSPIARAITGTRWNGLAFFGLKRRDTVRGPR